MAVAYADYGMAALEGQILLTFVIPYLTTLSLHDVHVEQGIYVK